MPKVIPLRPLTDEQSKLIEDNIALVYACLKKLCAAYPFYDKDAIYDCCIDAIIDSSRLYDSKKGKFSTLVYSSAFRDVSNYTRLLNCQKRKGITISLDYENEEDEEIARWRIVGKEDDYSFIDIKRGFSVLTEKEKDMVYRNYYIGETQREIGDAYGISSSRVGFYITRALKKMKAHLEG